MEIINGVAETLQYLAPRHHLILMTKGNITEQTGKIERSGLKEYFAAMEIVAEKNVPTYRSVIEKYELLPESSWMIGNSPKSDINPAIGAGLERGVRSARQYVDPGTRRSLRGNRRLQADPGGEVQRSAEALLTP